MPIDRTAHSRTARVARDTRDARDTLRSARLAVALLASVGVLLPSACAPQDPPVSANSLASRHRPGTCSCVCRQPRHDSFPVASAQTSDETDFQACDQRCAAYEMAHSGASCERLFRKADARAIPVAEIAAELNRALPAAKPDADGDTTPDDQDKCPDQVGPRENSGCPDKDTDGDGIVDRNDRCIDQRGHRDAAGCPDTDADNDGIPDRGDRCKVAPETQNGFQDEDGCPDEVPAALARFTGRIEGIVFKTGSAVIDSRSFSVLEKSAQALKEFPQARFEISGHTDSSGDAQSNTDLSRRRAEAVKKWLVTNGIADARLTTAGYGPSQPLADNKSATGRSQNRRVEFKLLSGTLAR